MPSFILLVIFSTFFLAVTHLMVLAGINIYPEGYLTKKYMYFLVGIFHLFLFLGFVKKKRIVTIAFSLIPMVHDIIFYLEYGNADWFHIPMDIIEIAIWYVGFYVYFNLPKIKQYFGP